MVVWLSLQWRVEVVVDAALRVDGGPVHGCFGWLDAGVLAVEPNRQSRP